MGKDLLFLLLVVGGFYALSRWILPKLGIRG